MIELLRNYCATIASLPATPFTPTPIPLLRIILRTKSTRSDFRGACEKALPEEPLTVHPYRILGFSENLMFVPDLNSKCGSEKLNAELRWAVYSIILNYIIFYSGTF